MNSTEGTQSVGLETPSAAGAVQPPLAVGTRLAGRYEIRRLLGSGGYSHVYAASDCTLNREIAIKVLRADRISEVGLKRMRREVLVAQKTRNPNLLRIYDFAQDGDNVFLTMELVSGASLREKIAKAPLSVEESIGIAMDVLEGLHELQLSGIVHRDVKPGNILIDENGAVRLADFGLVRELDSDESRATATDAVLGTLRYVSPEQALGRDVDARSDLFSLGIVLFEMLTQRAPFDGESSLGTLLAHIHRKAPDVRTFRPDVPRWLAAVIARLLERNPEFRYPSAIAVIQDLEKHRARIAPAKLRRMIASVALVALVLAGTFTAMTPRSRLDRIAIERNQPARGLDESGATLWTRADLHSPEVVAIVNTREGRRVAAFLRTMSEGAPVRGFVSEMSLLDAETGEVVETVTLPAPSRNFDDLPMNFGPGAVLGTDLDGDGYDEIVISFVHFPYYPSFTVVYFPTSGRSQYVFAARGHHRVAGAVDVDGDGMKEVVIAGINNRLGWQIGVAAVRVDPLDRSHGTSTAFGIPSSPDSGQFGSEMINDERLVFYTLLPEVTNYDIDIDEVSRLIHVKLGDGQAFSLTFDGFVGTDTSDLAPEERNMLRREAYRSLRLSDLEAGLGHEQEGLRLAEDALEYAERAGDDVLATWSRRVTARRLVDAGRIADAERSWDLLIQDKHLVYSVAWDAGRALHAAGQIDRAVDWYERGIARSRGLYSGRSIYQYMEGVALALAEADRGAELRRRAVAWRSTLGTGQFLAHFEAFARWIDGLDLEWGTDQRMEQGPDLQRMWEYEFRRTVGADPATLLEQFDEDPLPVEAPPALMSSFRAELLADLGRLDEAIAEARNAWDAVLSAPSSDLVTRAHRRIIGERCVKLSDAKKLSEEAARVRAELGR